MGMTVRTVMLIGVLVLMAGCGSETVPGDRSAGEREPGRPDRIDKLCPPGGDCVDGISVDGVAYLLLDCPPAPEGVLGPVIANGGTDERFDQARSVDGFDPAVVVAVHRLGQVRCASGTSSEWLLAYDAEVTTEAEARELARAQCDLPTVPLDDCADGIGWRSPDSFGEDQNTAWPPEVVASVNDRLARGEPVPGHGDPVDAVAVRLSAPNERTLEDYLLYRIGVQAAELSTGRATVLVLYQNGMLYNRDDPGYCMVEETWVAEQLDGGPGWFVTSKRSGACGRPTLGDRGREAVDQRWATCCDRVIVDHERP